jgi:hypothetical protein
MAFGPSNRTRRKALESASTLLGSSVYVREVGFGRAHKRWTTTATVISAIFGSAFVLALLFGVALFPGGVALLVVLHSVWPPRAVAVADQGVALLQRSVWTGRPNKVIALLPHQALVLPVAGDALTRGLGPDTVRFKKAELARLMAALPVAAGVPTYR